MTVEEFGLTTSGENADTTLPNKKHKPPDLIRELIYKLPSKYRPILPIFAGILLMLSFGTIYTQGNMNPYILSYMRQHGEPNITVKRMTWMTSFQAGFPFSMLLGGILGEWIGLRPTATVGSLLICTGTALTYYTVRSTFPLILLTNSVFIGFGVAMAYDAVLVCGMSWLPRRPGLATGLLLAGVALGSFVFSPIQTAYINPNNHAINCGKYFCQPDLLANVTSVFLVLAICYAVLDIVGLMFLCSPRERRRDEGGNEGAPLLPRSISLIEYENSVGPIEVLKSGTFWSLAVAYLCNATLVLIMATYWKMFGQTFIRDDFFLTATIALSSVCNCFGRIIWGYVADRFSFRTAMAVASCIQAILAFTLTYTSLMHRIFFLLWICAIYFTYASNFTLFPMATANCFGPKHVGVNYGMLFTVNQFSYLGLSLMSEILFDQLSYLGIFVTSGALSVISCGLTLTVPLTKFGKGAILARGMSSWRLDAETVQ